MGLKLYIAVFMVICTYSSAFGCVVFFKDGTKETGNSVWIEGNTVYLSRSQTVFEYPGDEVLLEKTMKDNRLGKYADNAILDSRNAMIEGANKNDLIDQILKGSNFDQQIDKFLRQFQSGAMSSIGDNRELGDVFTQALEEFDPLKAKRRIRAYYRSHLDIGTLQAVLAWTQTPLGMKVRDMETSVDVMSPDAAQKILNEMEGNPPPPRRRALIRDLDEATRSTRMARQMVAEAIYGAMGALPANTAEKKRLRREMLKQVKRQKSEIEAQLRKQVQISLTYAYRDLSDNELREYIAFMRTAPAVKFSRATMGAMSEMTRSMSASIIKHIVKAAEEKYGSVR